MPSPHKKTVGTLGSILLVEEYRPLAMAFGSAVKKFAGNFETRVAASLAEADKSFRRFQPDLIVIDFDPPLRGSVKFFQDLQVSLPNSHLIILLPNEPAALTDIRAIPSAFHFVAKPFELEKFGIEIKRVLKSRSPEGRIRDLDLIDLIALYASSGASLTLRVEGGGARSGEIHFFDGRISHAQAGVRSGIEGLQTILHWRSPSFTETERPSDAPRSIQGAWTFSLREAFRLQPPMEEIETAGPEGRRQTTNPPEEKNKKIVIVDDTELLSVFVQEILSTSDPTLAIMTSPTGLEGLKRIAASKPDLVLLDYSLPDVKGDEVARRLLEDPETANIPIIMMSGHVPEMAATAERFENVVATIAKPFLSSALIEVVKQTLTHPRSPGVPRPKKSSDKPVPVERAEPHVIAAKKARNGKRASARHVAPTSKAIELPKPKAGPTLEEIEEEVPLLPATPLVEKEEVLDPFPVIAPSETEFAEPVASLEIPALETSHLPAAITAAKANAVVLGIPLEVVSIELSIELRIQRIRARLFSPTVAMRVLPRADLGTSVSESIFELAEISLTENSQIDTVKLAPASTPFPKFSRYPTAIDGVSIAAEKNFQTIELIPTAVAPMRLQLLSLFEMSSVELSPDFHVAQLILKSRGAKIRATFSPELAQTGATFEIVEVRIERGSPMGEIVLQSLPA